MSLSLLQAYTICKCVNKNMNGYFERQKEEYQIKRIEQKEWKERVKRYRQYQRDSIPIIRKIRAEQRMKRKVEEAMNNLPIHEQENIKEVLKKISDDDVLEILKNINIDEIINEFLNNK